MKRIAFLIFAATVLIFPCMGKKKARSRVPPVSPVKEADEVPVQEEGPRPGPYDFLDLSDKRSARNRPAFTSDLDERAWKVLAGIYVKDEAPDSLPEEMWESDTPWGKDYIDFGGGELTVFYKDGEWYFRGGGMTEVVELVSISSDGKRYELQNDWYPITCTVNGAYLDIMGEVFYKLTGPDCYKRFLKEFTKEYRTELSD